MVICGICEDGIECEGYTFVRHMHEEHGYSRTESTRVFKRMKKRLAEVEVNMQLETEYRQKGSTERVYKAFTMLRRIPYTDVLRCIFCSDICRGQRTSARHTREEHHESSCAEEDMNLNNVGSVKGQSL